MPPAPTPMPSTRQISPETIAAGTLFIMVASLQ
jgi:hypothetical protein